jgi:uncharacterized cupin superfamily protein
MPARSPEDKRPAAVAATAVPLRVQRSVYPEPFASRMRGREKRQLGNFFGLSNFGVNLTMLAPGAVSSLRHAHTRQDEFIYVMEGHPTLVTDEGSFELAPGMCAGFASGTGNAHHLKNTTELTVVYLEVGDRSAGDEAAFPDDDLKAVMVNGQWVFAHKDGQLYD